MNALCPTCHTSPTEDGICGCQDPFGKFGEVNPAKGQVEYLAVAANGGKYRGWLIGFDPKPIPIRDFDWTAVHPNYDASYEGPEDGWVDNGLKASGASYEALCEEIDLIQDEMNEANSKFGVGA